MPQDTFRNLQEYLDRMSLGFPATESGVELLILQRLFTKEQASLFLAMTPRLETPGEIALRLQREVCEITDLLAVMDTRGLVFSVRKGDAVRYATIPFVHGLFEFQIGKIDGAMAELAESYFQEAFHGAMARSASSFLRTIPVQQSIHADLCVAPYEDAVQIFRSQEKIVVTECICRKQKGLLDRACDKPREVCFMFGSMGQYYLDHGIGRRLDPEEAIGLLTRAQEAGLVTQPATAQNPGGLCNCCGDCCSVLGALNALPRPAEAVFSNHFAALAEGRCTGCGICLDRCQMAAIIMTADEVATIDRDRCIGCGLCVPVCPAEAISLKRKEEGDRQEPPTNTLEQMIHMARKRGLI